LAEKDGVTAGETHQTIEATFRIERARLIAGLARMARNVDLAEELAQGAVVVALSEWPRTGVPANPGASGIRHTDIAALSLWPTSLLRNGRLMLF
jgi:predicted RNA polymerase sigma factor